ncbi:chemotaxis protein [Peribacillus sp. SCS-37]|uniref:chemotaxis protein n=1 Tax=Paraperibacillus esterisolvens TaxID=3115296 RepID=UPI0039061B25
MKQIAVAIIHGMGSQHEDYGADLAAELLEMFAEKAKVYNLLPGDMLTIQPVFWAAVFQQGEDELFTKLVKEQDLNYQGIRRFMIHYLADAIAYQPVETAKHNYYRVHRQVASSLGVLAGKTGSETPLCVISHSLGSVIASNFFYDLQMNQDDLETAVDHLTPLERGDTLSLFYTMGTTLPLWSLRYDSFDRPICIPSPSAAKYNGGFSGEWINFYDRDDVLAYPLKPVSPQYSAAVNEDREVNAGNILTNWNPFSHSAYLTDKNVLEPITDGLFRLWKHINGLK